VDSDLADASIRTTKYFFTEAIEKVYPDGSADIAATLDSFQTQIDIGERTKPEKYFVFNSNNDDDLKHNFHDIRALPRGQFLGQTLRYAMLPNGTIKQFYNLDEIHRAALGHDYGYELVHAMLSL